MKKILSLALCALMLVSMLALVGCGDDNQDDQSTPTTKAPETTKATEPTQPNNDNNDNNDNNNAAAKFGSALYVSNVAATDADEENNGKGTMDVTVAAVIVDGEGKIVACELDTLQTAVAFTIDGKAIANDSFLTKYEKGDEYKMVAFGGAKAEWYAQADSFENVVAGKTIAEVKALLIEGGKGNDEVVNAGCTIAIAEFVNAIEKAVANAKTEVDPTATLKVTTYTEQTCKDAGADDGSNKVSVCTFAAAIKDGKVVTADSDCVEADFKFDVDGFVNFDASKAILSKREQGDNYKMKNYETGYESTWAQQADAFDAQCEGKTADEIAGLKGENGKGVEAVQTAGCTIAVSGLVGAASKI